MALSSWAGGALAALHFAGVQGETVLCPSNTFMATPLAAIRAGAEVQFVDCNRDDLCMSFADFQRAAEQHKPRAAFLVHIGGHIAFEVEQIAALLRRERDLPHRGLRPRPRRRAGTAAAPGRGATPGVYSLYATKTISTGEGGVLVSRRPEVIAHARDFRNYGKPSYEVAGLNFRMSEFTAALGLVQIERLPEIVAWKNEVARDRARSAVRRAAWSCPRAWSPASTSTSSSTGSSARPAACTTSPATGSWATTSICPIPTGWRETTPAFRCITDRLSELRCE